MTTITVSERLVGTTPRRGVLARLVDAIIEARSRQAERIVAAHLLRLDDETLKSFGRERAELRRIAGSLAVY